MAEAPSSLEALPHDSAHLHVQGKSEYVDDRPFLPGELHVGVVLSERAHAKLKKRDITKAQKVPGVVAVFLAEDFSELLWGSIFHDQPLLAHDVVSFVGESVAIVAAENAQALREGCKAVRIEYQDLPAILSITAAREAKSFIGSERKIERGEVEATLQSAPHQREGVLVIKGADHFYLESQAAIAYPTDRGGIEVHASSQHPTEVQHVVAHALGLSYKDVVCVVKRMGGAFGGKESQGAPYAAYAALVAHKLRRPARIVLTKDDDMIATGKRNPFECRYRVGFGDDGTILALDVQLHSDGGAFADLSTAIMERAMLHCDNAYYIPHVRIRGQVCKTHFHPHTAFRGFGGPKGVAMIERIIEEIAEVTGRDALAVRKLNVYQPGRDSTPYSQRITNHVLPQLFAELESASNYPARRQDIERHNRATLKKSRGGTLRGLSLTAVKFGISFTTRYLNQGNALVIMHRDGSVQVSTGATEMGQGVNQRIAQLVAEELGISPQHVVVTATATDKNANTSPTAASSGTDLNGSAAVVACRKLKVRLASVAEQLFAKERDQWPSKTAALGLWPEIIPREDEEILSRIQFGGGIVSAGRGQKISVSDLVNEAYLSRVSLSEYGFYRVPNLSFDKLKGEGQAFLYFTNGVAASEVSVDRVSGEVKVLRTDILMDLGRPINEALDRGQITGGFVQGQGWLTTENLVYSSGGKLLTHSPSTYKIPSIHDTPRIFNVALLGNDGNTDNVRGSKAVGEPPLLLAISVWTAIRDALRYSRPNPQLHIPATNEAILRILQPDSFGASHSP